MRREEAQGGGCTVSCPRPDSSRACKECVSCLSRARRRCRSCALGRASVALERLRHWLDRARETSSRLVLHRWECTTLSMSFERLVAPLDSSATVLCRARAGERQLRWPMSGLRRRPRSKSRPVRRSRARPDPQLVRAECSSIMRWRCCAVESIEAGETAVGAVRGARALGELVSATCLAASSRDVHPSVLFDEDGLLS